MPGRRLGFTFLCLAAFSAATPSILLSQTNTATLRGRVVDSAGAGLPSIPVSVQRANQGGILAAITDVEGNYRIGAIPPANDYLLHIDYPGFGAVEVGPLDLDPGKTTLQNVTLYSIEEMAVRVQVLGHGNTVDTSTGTTNANYDSEFIEGIPLIGHRFQDLFALAPGVTDTDEDGNPNVHGARATGMQIRLDSANVTDPASGTFGQNVNVDIIEELGLVTGGAPAEFGRADGGFATIVTKSGGNLFEGKFSVFWQGTFLNGDGANNNDVNRFDNEPPSFHDVRPTLSLGGPVVKDRAWFFGSVELLDTERPVDQVGASILVTSRGSNSFAKITWQVDPFNKLAAQVSSDPLTLKGLGLALGVSPDSDFAFEQGGLTPQIKWTATLSPSLLLEASVTGFASGISVSPVSKHFEPLETEFFSDSNKTSGTIQAVYPCSVPNCDPALGEKRVFTRNIFTNRVNGPFPFKNDDSRTRKALRADLSYELEDAWGRHGIKTGIEISDETWSDEPINNPILRDATRPLTPDAGSGGIPVPGQVEGQQALFVSSPLQLQQRAASFNSGFFVQDSWKPRPNVTLNIGVRLDREDVDSSGFTEFDPRVERRHAVALWSAVCEAARSQGDIPLASSNCRDDGTWDGRPPTALGNRLRAQEAPPEVAALDLDGDGIVNVETFPDRAGLFEGFTTFAERQTRNFTIVNNNLAPRFSVAWDPWNDGKTRLFGNWSRFYDRLFLATVANEIGPDTLTFLFQPDAVSHRINPGAISNASSAVTVSQVDRGLKTPHTDEISVGFERELAPEWSVGLTYIRRRAEDLLQDLDINHFTCLQSREMIGISPDVLCEREVDLFGEVRVPSGNNGAGGNFDFNARAASRPNDAPDLYTVSNGFNQILRIGNYNSSRFDAFELKLVKRAHRNWQMQASYTWSKATGQAEQFASPLGNDPQTRDDEEGYLDFDQRHVLKFQGVAHLPHGIALGSVVQWASGTPYPVIRSVLDLDSTGNVLTRTFFPTGRRNDQRNPGSWSIDGRLEKSFEIGNRVHAGAFLTVENLVNDDNLVIQSIDTGAFDGNGLDPVRDAGRRFEIGAILTF